MNFTVKVKRVNQGQFDPRLRVRSTPMYRVDPNPPKIDPDLKMKVDPLNDEITMTDHKYILEPYSGMKSRHTCPGCNNRDKSFSRYINIETGEYIADNVGRCNREQKCGYHFTPKQFFEANGKPVNICSARNPIQSAKPVQTKFIPFETLQATLKGFGNNNFYSFLMGLFGSDRAIVLAKRYYIGSSKRWNGANIFWQVDIDGRVRTGKIMHYDPKSGKRTKVPDTGKPLIDWTHRYIGNANFRDQLNQCFFGEHLLKDDKARPVAVVESEKTAIIASEFLPSMIWLACGAKTGLNDKCQVLKGRKVILYPDLGCYEDWGIKAEKYGFMISDILEKNSTPEQKADGLDLADFLLINKPMLGTYPSFWDNWQGLPIDTENEPYILQNRLLNQANTIH